MPATLAMNKHMVPILNRPMIEYPIDTMLALGIEDLLIVSGGDHLGAFADYLKDGRSHGVRLTYRVQRDAGGIAQALGIAEDFGRHEGAERIAVILGDNIFDNEQLIAIRDTLQREDPDMAHLFVKEVEDPQRFGVLEIDPEDPEAYRIREKPADPQSKNAITGLYIYPRDVFQVIPKLTPSARGELEITDVNNFYIKEKRCVATTLGGFWSDAGTPDSLAAVTAWAYGR